MSGTGHRALAVVAVLLGTLGPAQANTADRRLGERLYREGINARGEPIRALVGMPPAPMSGAPAACGACHELPTGRVEPSPNAAPDLRWPVLTQAVAERSAVEAKPYTEASFALAVNEGIEPSGTLLSAAMPRYSLSRSEMAALVAFLKSVPTGPTKSR